MVGKTIARVEHPGYDTYGESDLLVLWFTDGTAVKLRATGYETDGVEATPTTAAALDAEFVEQIEYAIERAWSEHERSLRKVRECLTMAESYGGEDTRGYQRWYQNRYGMSNFAKAIKAEYTDAIAAHMRDVARQTFFFHNGDHIS